MTKVVSGACALAMVAMAGQAVGQVEVIYSRAPGSTSNVVPGAKDAAGNPVVTGFNTMSEFHLSPDGSRWMLTGTTTQPSTESNVLLIGSGTTGAVALQEAQPFPGAVGAEVVDFFGSTGAPFNQQNDWGLSIRAKGGVTGVGNKLLRYVGGVGSLRFQQTSPYTGTTDNPPANAGDETIGNSTLSAHLLNDGRLGWVCVATGGVHTSRRPVVAYDAVRFLQTNADTVLNLDGVTPINISGVASAGSINNFLTTPDGAHYVLRIRAGTGPTDPFSVAVDGRIVATTGQPLPNYPTIVPSSTFNGGLVQTALTSNGDWYLRGGVAGGGGSTLTEVFALRNGQMLAKSGDPIGSHAWGASFINLGGNNVGDWFLIGSTTNPDTTRDEIAVVNNEVILSEGDAVHIDLDGDPELETAYIGRANVTLSAFVAVNASALAPDGTFYVLANLRTEAGGGTDLNTALLRVSTGPLCGTSDFNGDGAPGLDDDIEAFFLCIGGDCCAMCWVNGSDFNGDGAPGLDDDIESFFSVLGGGDCV